MSSTSRLSVLQKRILNAAAMARFRVRPDYLRQGMDISTIELCHLIYGDDTHSRAPAVALFRAIKRLAKRGFLTTQRYQFGRHRSGIAITDRALESESQARWWNAIYECEAADWLTATTNLPETVNEIASPDFVNRNQFSRQREIHQCEGEPRMTVTQEQLDELKSRIVAGVRAEAAKYGETAIFSNCMAGKYWIMETGTLTPLQMQYQREPKRSDYKVAAILDTETGVFVKGTVSAKGFRLAKGQPKNPPTIDAYTVNGCGTVNGIGYPARFRPLGATFLGEVQS